MYARPKQITICISFPNEAPNVQKHAGNKYASGHHQINTYNIWDVLGQRTCVCVCVCVFLFKMNA